MGQAFNCKPYYVYELTMSTTREERLQEFVLSRCECDHLNIGERTKVLFLYLIISRCTPKVRNMTQKHYHVFKYIPISSQVHTSQRGMFRKHVIYTKSREYTFIMIDSIIDFFTLCPF